MHRSIPLLALAGAIATIAISAALLPRRAAAADPAPVAAPMVKSPLDFKVKDIDGKETPLSRYKGKVVLIVNTASKCGFTPQYASLESLFEKYKAQGFIILAFPANNYGSQEPGKDNEIKEFCTGKYKTSFDLFSKISTKGPDQAPLYNYLTSFETDPAFAGPVKWNFTKFLVDRDGKVIARFEPNVDPLKPEVTAKVETALKTAATPAKSAE